MRPIEPGAFSQANDTSSNRAARSPTGLTVRALSAHAPTARLATRKPIKTTPQPLSARKPIRIRLCAQPNRKHEHQPAYTPSTRLTARRFISTKRSFTQAGTTARISSSVSTPRRELWLSGAFTALRALANMMMFSALREPSASHRATSSTTTT